MKGIAAVINFTDPSLPGKKRFVVKPQTTDGPVNPLTHQLDAFAEHASTSLVLPGMGLLEYGQRIDQDLVYLLEHCAGTVPPVNPTIGELWFDSNGDLTKVWNGANWQLIATTKTIASYLDYNRLVDLINDLLAAPAISKPVNVAPGSYAVGVNYSPTFSASAYQNRYGSPQAGAQWQCATDPSFGSGVVFDTYQPGASVSFPYTGKLAPNVTFYFRVRYLDVQGEWSVWSDATSFATKQAVILTPTIVSPTSGSIQQPLNVTLVSSDIVTDVGSDALVSCEWNIRTAPNGGGADVYSRTQGGLSFTVPDGVLGKGNVYYVRVRQNGARLGTSPWSADCSFTTVRPTVNTPTIVSPASGSQTETSVPLYGSDLSIDGGSDTLARSVWEVHTGSGGSGNLVFSQTVNGGTQTSIPDGTLTRGSVYYARVYYVSNNYGSSGWSADSQFQVKHIAAGTVLSVYCVGYSYVSLVADGNGGTYERVEETNSARCGYVPYPPAGTILDHYCVGYSYVALVADGNGGSYERVEETNSPTCNYVPPPTYPPYGTVLSLYCVGVDKYASVADGSGGSFPRLEQSNSVDCGYVPPAPTFDYTAPGTYVIPGTPGVGTATVLLQAGGGGGGGGGHGGDGDSSGAGGGGGGGGGGGRTVYGLVGFPVGTPLTVVVGGGGAGGLFGYEWKVINGTWLTGADGKQGANGASTYIYDVNGTLLGTVVGGQGGYGGMGGGRADNESGAGGIPGAGTPDGSYGANAIWTAGGGGGAGGANGGNGGKGGNGVGLTGEDGNTGIRQRGLSGDTGASGSAHITLGGDTSIPVIPVLPLSATVYNGSFTNSPVYIGVYESGGVAPYTYHWNVIDNSRLTITDIDQLSCQVAGTFGTMTLSCTVTDARGISVTSNEAYVDIDATNHCVAIESFLPDGNLAGNIVVGSTMLLADNVTLDESTGVVTYSSQATVPGYRFETRSGAALRCSASAPIPTQQGYATAPNLMGEFVPVMHVDGAGNTYTTWEEVISVESIGDIAVQHITVGDRCFWAGESANAFILHHNIKAEM